jgi:hypothetical protein
MEELMNLDNFMPSDLDMGILNTSPYRLSQPDEFPIATYMYYKHKSTPKYVYTTNCFGMKLEDLSKLLIENNYTLLFNKKMVDRKLWFNTFVFETHNTLVRFGSDTSHYTDDIYPFGGEPNDTPNEGNIDYITIMSNDSDEYEWIIDIIDKHPKQTVHRNKVSLVVQDHGGYRTERFELPTYELDLKTNYPSEFEPIHQKILSTLSETDSKGLVLLHGTPGTGKTHYLKHIASLIEGKEILFIPPFLTDFLTSPEMIPFLISKKNSILFIEDAERVITDRSDTNSSGVANILNLTDGILSDILNIQIVATFNMDKQKIDPALLRKGRLIAEYEFKELPTDMSNTLLKKLGSDVKADKPMTLTEIYNIAEPEFKEEVKIKPKIGFG